MPIRWPGMYNPDESLPPEPPERREEQRPYHGQKCPVCGHAFVKKHCDDGGHRCAWVVCAKEDCEAFWDQERPERWATGKKGLG